MDNTKKRCPACKHMLSLNEFDGKSKCNLCREKINGKHKKNTCEICDIRANFNHEGQTRGRFCKTHAEPGMVNVISKRCEADGCKSQPTFDHEGQTRGRFCKTHAEPGMVDVISKRCEADGCKSLNPPFNHEGETRGRFCKTHAEPGMVDVKHKRCEADGCKSLNRTFNHEGETRGRFCKTHAEPGMVDVISKRCEADGCKSLNPTFNNPEATRGRFCKTHAEPGMADVITKRCEADGCKSLNPAFNHEGETRGRFCKTHAKAGMVNVISKRCEADGCDTRANFGYCAQPATHCARHKTDKMFLRPTRTCSEDDCKDISTHGEKEPTHCEAHSSSSQFCLLAKKCQGKQCPYPCELQILNRNGLCEYCEPELRFQQLKQREKVFEKLALKYLDENVAKNLFHSFEDDKIVDSSCNKRRPDRIYDCGTHKVVLEIDERQHATYDSGNAGCEKSRMFAIQEAVGMHCIFLRFNPNNFRVKNVLQKVNMRERLELVAKWLKVCLKMTPKDDLCPPLVKYLFYDEWQATDTSFQKLTE
jgi:hypothetical protein